ncbi:cupin domain-containing protein [Achromobacter denitrificans]|uniref:cupin domain-containing protein n=1 Tax=Achromobacter denitrificans TaxID=32002 RepID=UPI000F4EBCB4|nr:cupin domain-containing protein [Achromobacter denitrificans]MBV2162364.1 cupin domain-containing protein [Achromobacter denitrificans]MDX3881436.1 cupin domain-containing protein [Achromobacter sp.]QCS66163.1 cupin domain-containing protein [Achromobacter denitrificans]WFC65665.1 cupin domain-containing protein [Achromobacter denitrificans]
MLKIFTCGLPRVAAGLLAAPFAFAAPPHPAAHAGKAADPIVTELMTRDLADAPGKDVLMITVDYPPGAADPVHRHDADSFIYVLQGSIVMQLKGGKEVTLHPGQTFYEGPDDVHIVGRNASQTEPARFLVLLIKKRGAPAVLPAE